MKKILSILLILCMLLPSLALAAGNDAQPLNLNMAVNNGKSSKGTDPSDEELGGAVSPYWETDALKLTLKGFVWKANTTIDGEDYYHAFHSASGTHIYLHVRSYTKTSISTLKSRMSAAGCTLINKSVRGNSYALGRQGSTLHIHFNTPTYTWYAFATYSTTAQKNCMNDVLSTLIGTKTPTLTGSNLSRSKASTTKSYGLTFSTNSKGTIKFSSSTSKVTVNELGKIKVAANWKGTATITMKLTAYGYYASKTKTLTVTIK